MAVADILEWKSTHPLRYVEPITPTVIADVLDLAAETLDKRGWCRGFLGCWGGPLCARGAIFDALGGIGVVESDSWAKTVWQKTEESLLITSEEVGEWGSVPYWNDSADLSKEKVAGLFRDLARQMRKKEGDHGQVRAAVAPRSGPVEGG